jgi:hypothetical protein
LLGVFSILFDLFLEKSFLKVAWLGKAHPSHMLTSLNGKKYMKNVKYRIMLPLRIEASNETIQRKHSTLYLFVLQLQLLKQIL